MHSICGKGEYMETQKPARSMRSFLIIWAGQLISLLGSSLTDFALGVWIFKETGQATPFALIGLASLLPSILLAPVGGSLADRFDRKKLIVFSDSVNALTTLTAFFLFSIGSLHLISLMMLTAVGSAARALQGPSFSSSISMLVDKENLVRANGLNQLSQSVCTLLAPIIAGFLYGIIGLKGIFIIDFITYFFALGAVLITTIPMPKIMEARSGKKNVMSDLRFAFSYLKAKRGMLGIAIVFGLFNFVLSFASIIMTPYILTLGTTEILGTVQFFMGIGMFAGAAAISVIGKVKRKIPIIALLLTLVGLFIIPVGLTKNWIVIAVSFFLMMLSVSPASSLADSILQTKVEHGAQGRVFGLVRMLCTIMMPLAYVITGPLVDTIFEPAMRANGILGSGVLGTIFGTGAGRGMAFLMTLSGMGTLFLALWLFFNPAMHAVDDLPDADSEHAHNAEDELLDVPAEMVAVSDPADTVAAAE